jgi:hypothetical protein
MMRVPKRGIPYLGFDIDSFLRPDNAERRRATAIVVAKLPPEALPHLMYLSTNYHRQKWRHTFLVNNAKLLGLKRKWYHVPCRMAERKLPLILIDAMYHDPVHDCNYGQHATLSLRTGNVEIYQVVRHRAGGFDEEDLVTERVLDEERML